MPVFLLFSVCVSLYIYIYIERERENISFEKKTSYIKLKELNLNRIIINKLLRFIYMRENHHQNIYENR